MLACGLLVPWLILSLPKLLLDLTLSATLALGYNTVPFSYLLLSNTGVIRENSRLVYLFFAAIPS